MMMMMMMIVLVTNVSIRIRGGSLVGGYYSFTGGEESNEQRVYYGISCVFWAKYWCHNDYFEEIASS
jgi:hypothetical protein